MSFTAGLERPSAPRRRKTLWQIIRGSHLITVLALTLVAALLASAFLPGAPEEMLAWTRPSTRGASTAALGAFALLALVPLLLAIAWNIIARWSLVRRGVVAQGVVIRTEGPLTPPPAPGQRQGLFRFRPPYRVDLHYRFRDAAGLEHEGREQARDGWSAPKPGDAIAVLYDPGHPHRSVPEDDLTV